MILHVLQLAEYIKFQLSSNWLRMDPGMRDMGYGQVWTWVSFAQINRMCPPLYNSNVHSSLQSSQSVMEPRLSKIEDIEDDEWRWIEPKINFGTGTLSRSDDRAAAQFRGLALPHYLLIYCVINATVPRGWRTALWPDSQVEWSRSQSKDVQKTLEKDTTSYKKHQKQSVFMVDVERCPQRSCFLLQILRAGKLSLIHIGWVEFAVCH